MIANDVEAPSGDGAATAQQQQQQQQQHASSAAAPAAADGGNKDTQKWKPGKAAAPPSPSTLSSGAAAAAPTAPAPPPSPLSPLLERAYRKTRWAVLAPAILAQFFSQLDRNNLSFAALTLNRDLGMGAADYGAVSAAFFVTFCLCQVPANLLMLRVGVRPWLTALLVGWGAVAACFAAARSRAALYALRLLLGMLEAGASPALWWLFSQFFPPARLAFPFSALNVGIMLSAALGAPIAVGLLALDGTNGLAGWQWLFIIEGVATLLVAGVWYAAARESVAAAWWLTREERRALEDDLAESRTDSPPRSVVRAASPWRLLRVALSRPMLLVMCCVGFIVGAVGYVLIFWMPIVINTLLNGTTLTAASAAGGAGRPRLAPIAMSAVPPLASLPAMWLLASSSERFGRLPLHTGGALVLAGALLAVFPAAAGAGAGGAGLAGGFVTLALGSVSYSAANGLVVALAARAARGEAQALGIPCYTAVATAGGAVGPALTGALVQRTGSFAHLFVYGVLLVAAGAVVAAFDPLDRWFERRRGAAAAAANASAGCGGGNGNGSGSNVSSENKAGGKASTAQ